MLPTDEEKDGKMVYVRQIDEKNDFLQITTAAICN
jgi:hypothetical protein